LPQDNREFPSVWTPEHEARAARIEELPHRVSRAATLALLLGLAGLFCLGPLAAVPGLLVSLLAIARTGRRGMLGRGRALAGLLLAALTLGLWTWVFASAERRSRALLCWQDLRARLGAATDGSGPRANERRAIRALERLRAVQEKHKATHGTYARGLGSLVADDPGCAPIATSHSKLEPHHGYYFSSIIVRGPGFVDHTREFLIMALPAEPGRSGHRTFIIGRTGAVLGKDVGGEAITDAEQVKGWPPAE
jgi:hypothetical protein